MTVADRFRSASVNPPLSDLSPAAGSELAAVLQVAERFEDLPGKWQAALLQAESCLSSAPAPRRCCGGHATT